MNDSSFEKLSKESMADSRLRLPNPFFEDGVMNQILYEYTMQKKRKYLLLNILIFISVELIILTLLWMLLLYFPGLDYFSNNIKNSLTFIQMLGNLVLQYDYIIFSFIIVGFLDIIMNKRVKVSFN